MIRFLFFLFFIINSFSVYSQSFNTRRDWLIGEYFGVVYDLNSPGTLPYSRTVKINYSKISNVNSAGYQYDDSTCFSDYDPYTYYVCADSSLSPSNACLYFFFHGGKLYNNDSLKLWYECPMADCGLQYKYLVFYGKKTVSYLSTKSIDVDKTFYPFPNPAKNNINIGAFFMSENKQFYYRIYSIDGQLLNEDFLSKDAKIDIQQLARGVYYLTVTNMLDRYKAVFVKE